MPIKFCSEAHLFLGSRTPSLKSLPEDLCSGFLLPEKIHRPQPGLNPRTLDPEASTLSRDHRGDYGLNVCRHLGVSTYLLYGTILEALLHKYIKLPNWMSTVQDQPKLRIFVEKAKT